MPTMDRNGTGLLRGWSLDIYFIKSGNVSCDPKEQCTKDKMGLPFQCFINEVPSSPHHCPACVSPKIWNTWHVRQLRQKSCFHRLFWSRLLCAERWQSRGNHAKNSFQFERPFQGFICSKSSLNILNTVRWSVSGTVSIPIMSPLLLRTMLCFNTHYGFQQSFDFNVSQSHSFSPLLFVQILWLKPLLTKWNN